MITEDLLFPVSAAEEFPTIREPDRRTNARKQDGPDAPHPARRILVVDQSGELGGAQLALLPLVAAWGGRCETVLLADGPFRHRLQAAGAQVSVLAEARVSALGRRGGALRMLLALPSMIRQARALARKARSFDVVYLNTQKALVLGAWCSRRHGTPGTPVVWHAHDIMTREHFGRLRLWLVRFVVRHRVDHVIANSHASADALLRLTGLPATSISVLHNGISPAQFERVDEAGRAIRRASLHLPSEAFVAALVGRFAPWKGTHVALDAVAMVRGVHLLLIGAALFGEHEYEAFLRRRVEALRIADRVHFLGFRDDVPGWMKAADVVLHASIAPEPFGRVVVEGMLARRPVVATEAGGVPEIIEHRVTGLLVPPNDPHAMADALASLMAAPVWAGKMGELAFETACRRFPVEGYIAAVSRCLEEVEPTMQTIQSQINSAREAPGVHRRRMVRTK